jgi:hypothetical protein
MTNHGTDADIALVKRVPEVAKSIPDPSRTVTRHEGGRLTGQTIYDWRVYAEFYVDGTFMLGWQTYFDQITWQDGTIQAGALQVDSVGPAGGWEATIVRQRIFNHCVIKVGCYAVTYPSIQLTVVGNGGSYGSGSTGA